MRAHRPGSEPRDRRGPRAHRPGRRRAAGTGQDPGDRGQTPAWTPPFSRADKIATDGGNLVAHISLIAREYGIPAVVAVCDTSRLVRDSKVRRRSYEEDNRHSTREFNVDGNSIHCSVRRVMWILLSR